MKVGIFKKIGVSILSVIVEFFSLSEGFRKFRRISKKFNKSFESFVSVKLFNN